ncbi:MAG: D-alanine--D-alanine ligase family protein [Polyangiaceae bacterium]
MGGKKRVAIVFGGRSAEHEIAILSARFVLESLDRDAFEPVLIGIDKHGKWLLQEEALLLQGSRDPRLARLNQGMPEATLAPHPGADGGSLSVAGREGLGVDVVFPVLHGPFGEDGCIQGLLAMAGLPHVGAGVLGSAVGMDKDVMKRLLRDAALPLVPHTVISASAWERSRAACIERAASLGYPAFVKPACLGSSVGVTKAADLAGLVRGIDEAFAFDVKVVVEAGVPDVRELECAILGNDEPRASRVGEITVNHADGFYSYAAKYVDEHGVEMHMPARIPEEEERAVQAIALRAFKALECEGLARVDLFRSGDGKLYVNEINTIPGFTAISMYPKLWELSGVPPKELVSELIRLAFERAARRSRLRTSAAP